jgi:hypothetical protein
MPKSLLEQLKQSIAVERAAGKHPLLKMNAPRDVRDAYFQGIVLAAFIDDNKVDAEERAYLAKMGVAFGLPEEEVEGCIDFVGGIMDGDGSGAFVKELAESLKSPAVAKLFLAEFSLIWTSHASNMEKWLDWCNVFVSLLQLELPDGWLKALSVAISDSPQRVVAIGMLKCFDEETLAYLFGDVATKAASSKNGARDARTRNDDFVEFLVETVSKREDWNAEYDRVQIMKRAKDAGIAEHVPSTILKLLLPQAEQEFKKFCADIPQLRFKSDSDYRTVMVDTSPHGLLLLNYLKLFDSLTTRAAVYRIVDGYEMNYEHGKACTSSFSWKWRSKDGEEEAHKAIKELYRQMLSEFTFRATF